jgi:hypothetical protein
MSQRLALGILVLLAVVGLYVAAPVFNRLIGQPTARAVEPRGELWEIERATISLFERVSPSVVQVAGRSGAAARLPRPKARAPPARASCGTRRAMW